VGEERERKGRRGMGGTRSVRKVFVVAGTKCHVSAHPPPPVERLAGPTTPGRLSCGPLEYTWASAS
jgi:hypothetical protein